MAACSAGTVHSPSIVNAAASTQDGVVRIALAFGAVRIDHRSYDRHRRWCQLDRQAREPLARAGIATRRRYPPTISRQPLRPHPFVVLIPRRDGVVFVDRHGLITPNRNRGSYPAQPRCRRQGRNKGSYRTRSAAGMRQAPAKPTSQAQLLRHSWRRRCCRRQRSQRPRSQRVVFPVPSHQPQVSQGPCPSSVTGSTSPPRPPHSWQVFPC